MNHYCSSRDLILWGMVDDGGDGDGDPDDHDDDLIYI